MTLSKEVKRVIKMVSSGLSDTIYYEKEDAGELAKKIVRARKNKQTKNYKDAIKKGYEKLGKSRTRKSKVLNNEPKYKIPKIPSTGIGVGG